MKSKLNIFFNAPLYNVVIAILALISIVFSILDFGNVISLLKLPYIFIDNGIILIFAFDYFGRFWISKNKGNFLFITFLIYYQSFHLIQWHRSCELQD